MSRKVGILDEATLRLLSEASPLGIFVADLSKNLVYANTRFREMLGLTLEESLDTGWVKAIHPGDREKITWADDYGEGPLSIRYLHPDGRVVWTILRITAIREGDAIQGFLGTSEDITEQRRIKKALNSHAANVEALLDSAGAAVYSLDKDLRYTLFNRVYKDVMLKRRGLDVHIGDRILEVLSRSRGNDREVMERIFTQVLAGTPYFGVVNLGEPDVHRAPIELACNPVRDDTNAVTGIAVFARDLSDVVRIQKESQEKTQLLNTLLENLPVVVYRVDARGIVTLSMGAGLRALGLADNELVGRSAVELMPDVKEHFENASKGQLSSFISRGYKPDQNLHYQQMLFSDPFSGGIIGLALDVTASKQAEIAKQQFLSNMSHEIRTPLNAIIGMTHLMLQEDPNPDQKNNLRILQFSAENLLALVNDILDYTKIISGKIDFEDIDFQLSHFIDSVKQSHLFKATEKRVALQIKMDPKLPDCLNGDPIRLAQILNNLISNAIKFTPEEGRVTIDLSLHEESREAAEIDFSVKDTGIGIAPSQKEYIFENFTQASADTTRRFGGTGLGLAITKRLLELLGSDILLDSEVGKGSNFYFRLNIKKSEKEQRTMNSPTFAGSEADTQDLSGFKVLLAEDNEMNRIVASKFMKRWALEVGFAQNGEEAVEAAKSEAYNLVLMDLQMPKMDGYEATRQIRAIPGGNYPTIPIIALTASVEPEIVERIKHAGMDDYVSKPFNPNELYKKIADHLMQYRRRHPNP